MDACASTAITIGGPISHAVFNDMVQLIVRARLHVDWDGPLFEPSLLDIGVPLFLHAYDVAGGHFPELEEYCVDHDIAFARWSGASFGAFAAERVVFTGTGEPRSFTADEDNRILLLRDTAQLLGSYDAVLAYFDDADFIIPPLVIAG